MLKRSLAALAVASVASLSAFAQDQAGQNGAADAKPSVTSAPETAPAEAARTEVPKSEAATATPPASTRPVETATPASVPAKPVATTAEKTAPAVADDPAPAPAAPDPLTPAKVDEGPVKAPVPERAEIRKAPAEDPAIAAIRDRLDKWEAREAGEKADLAALRSFFAEPTATRIWTKAEGLSAKGADITATLQRAETWGLDSSAFELPVAPMPGSSAEALIEAEIRLSLAALKYARHARGGRIDPPSLSKMVDMRPRLFEPRSVLDALDASPDAAAYLEGLNPKHAGFTALKEALAKVRAGHSDDTDGKGHRKGALGTDAERRLLVNMERWRWLPDDLGQFHVWDNVPEQVTRVVHDGRVALKERIVVGKPNTPTPMFSAPMRFVIFHPSWGVPEGIKTNELAPMLRRAQSSSSGWFFSDNDGASRALRRHELRVYRGGREVNPDSINWSSVDVRQFSFQQPPSGRNVLGIVKFRFPNKFDVYMHDTSERHLFSRSPRTFSHGCMRVENPLKLAETILAYDKGWGRERIAALAAKGSTTDVTLEKNVPVHIVYFTATVDEAGKLHSHADVYGMDSRVASALAGRSVLLASARETSEEKPAASPDRPKERKARKPERQVKSAKAPKSGGSGLSFDPFSSLSAN
ncbi:MAG: murein L,D-transpeptidase [Hyphomicrobiaceae bacterium]